jgi:hypothetical protein
VADSGLLAERLGGPSVKPYQPAGRVKELTGTEDYQQDHGESLYRRSLYTFWKRTVAPPQMLTFDAAGRARPSAEVADFGAELCRIPLRDGKPFQIRGRGVKWRQGRLVAATVVGER